MKQLRLIPVLLCGCLQAMAADEAVTVGDLEGRQGVIPEVSAPEVGQEATQQQTMELYRQYLEHPDTDANSRLEALRRLGDMNAEAAEEAELAQDQRAAQLAYQNEAIAYYQQILESEEGFHERDMVLYQLSRTYESIGELELALTSLDQLVTEHPDSQYYEEAQFRRGEILFVYRNYFDATLAYQAVVDQGEGSAYYEQALYKLGWAQFKEAEYDATINTMLDLLNRRLAAVGVNEADAVTGTMNLQARFDAMSRPERELVDDTLRALSLTFSYMDGPETITAYLDKRDGNDPAYLLYLSLGELYLSKERFVDAAETFDTFVAREPYHPNSPDLAMRSLAVYQQARFADLVLERKRDFVVNYGLESEYWAYHDPEERDDVVGALKANLIELAEYDHSQAQLNDDPAAYARAADSYRRYIAYFPEDPDSAERSFLLGEVLMETQQYSEANDAYLRAAYEYPNYDNAGDSGYAALLASQAHYQTLEAEVAEAWLTQQLRQAVQFVQTFPEHEQTPLVLTNTAETYYASAEQDEALVVAGQLLMFEEPASAELRRVSWTVVGHGHFDLGHFARAEIAYLELRSMGDAGRVTNAEGLGALTAVEIDERIAASIYRQAEGAQMAGSVDIAVMHYLRVEKVTPNASIAAQSTYDGSALLFNEERYIESIEVMTGFRVTYPEHPVYANDITRNLAVAYQRSDQPLLAAVEYEAVAAFSIETPEIRREALYTAAELYEEGEDINSGRRVWRQVVAEYPQPIGENIELQQHLADLASQMDDIADRHFWLGEIITTDAGAGEQRTMRTKTLAARATFELTEVKRAAFMSVTLTIPLEQSITGKKALMEEALEGYNNAAGYEILEITTAATHRIAELYQRLSADLMDSQRPDGLSTDELEQYDILLEEQAFPFEEKAIEVYEVNVVRASKGMYDSWVAQSYAQLAILMPGRYAKYEKVESNVAQLY